MSDLTINLLAKLYIFFYFRTVITKICKCLQKSCLVAPSGFNNNMNTSNINIVLYTIGHFMFMLVLLN